MMRPVATGPCRSWVRPLPEVGIASRAPGPCFTLLILSFTIKFSRVRQRLLRQAHSKTWRFTGKERRHE